MKKLLIALSLLVGMGLSADNTLDENMKHMRDGLLDIQDGFLYNDKDRISKGIETVKRGNMMFKDQKSITKYLPDGKKHLSGVTFNSAQRLDSDIDELSMYLKDNQFLAAAGMYSDVIRNCTRCHAIVRGW